MRCKVLLAMSILWFLAGCSSTDDDATSAAVTYHEDIRPLVEQHCSGCHSEGGIGPFVLDDYESLKRNAQVSLAAIENGRMPPWQPDPDCRRYKDERLMTQEEKDLFREWVEEGTAEGAEADYVAPEQAREPLGEPDIVGRQSGPYSPVVHGGDEYRCFLMDATFEEETFLRAVDIDPGNRAVVHHANMFLINERNVEAARSLEAEDGNPGWDCFGDTGVPTLDLISAWVPGAQPIALTDDMGVRVPQGAAVVMQVHFNTLYADPVPVETELHLFTRDDVPDKTARGMPIADLNIEIPPGEENSEHVIEVPNLSDEPWEVFGAAAHLHLLGASAKMEVIREDGSEECLLDIPDWDFDWQQAYFFHDDDRTYVQPGDKVRLTCVFDNSPGNQPVIDGERQQPEKVTWGGGSTDEMCLSFLTIAEEFDPDSGGSDEICGDFQSCRESCDTPDSVGCLLNCGTQKPECQECLLNRAMNCTERHCQEEFDSATGCLLTCAQGAQAGGNIDQCLKDTCPVKRDALESCMRPVVTNGHCDADLAPCNVSLAQ